MKTSTLLLPLYPLLALGASIKTRQTAADVVTYAPFTSGGRTQYCGDTAVTHADESENAPLAADCAALATHYLPIDGYFTVEIPATSDKTAWHPVARYGTCTFAVRRSDGNDAILLDVGTHDIYFHTRASSILAKNGRLGAWGGVMCFAKGKHTGAHWGLIKI